MAVNTSKVIAGGIAAGVVLNLIDFVANGFLLADRMTSEANAFKPGLGDMMAEPSGGELAAYLIMNFVVGILLVWSYAAFRARFGPGPRTASYVALTFFVFGLVMTSGYMMMGMMSRGLWFTYAAIWIVNLLLATMLGARIYSEEGATT